MTEKYRESLFDNIKAVMLILVAMGHTLDPFITSQDSLFRYIMQYIYLFHMPMFAFVTGYFTKDGQKARETAVRKVLIPYLLIQSVYILAALIFMYAGAASYNDDVFKPSILLPTSPMYYLLCVFIWKLMVRDLQRLRFPMILSVLAGVFISIIENDEFHIGVGASFSLLIFFVLGTKCTERTIQYIRKIPKAVGMAVMILGIVPAICLPYNFRNVRFTYHYVGLDNVTGIIYRLLFYLIAVAMIFAIVNLFPQRRCFLSRIGENSIIVYAGSSFAAPFAYLLIVKVVPLEQNTIVNLAGIIVFSIAIAFIFSMKWIKRIYASIVNAINNILFEANK